MTNDFERKISKSVDQFKRKDQDQEFTLSQKNHFA